MFKPTSRCRPPHLNADVLRDELYQAGFVLAHDISSSQELVEKLEQINLELSRKYNPDFASEAMNEKSKKSKSKKSTVTDSEPLKGKQNEQAEAKARLYNFYLGMGDKLWMK